MELLCRVIAVMAALTLFAPYALGQDASDETPTLVKALGLPGDTHVAISSTKSLPSARPLKLHISVGLDEKTQEKFLKWVADWNRGDAKKYGAIELVDSASDADVVLARIIRMDQTKTQHAGVMTGGLGMMLSADAAPLYSYVLVRSDDGLRVVYRDLRQVNIRYTHMFADKLWDAFKDAMKKRPKGES